MDHCVFCKIVAGEIPAKIIDQDDQVLVIQDLHPVAPVHVLIIARQHFTDICDLAAHPEGLETAKAMLQAIPRVARKLGVDQSGFRLINNCGSDGGQTIAHIHIHLIGGRSLGEGMVPPPDR